ncbi:hypothetical protein [Micromonospora sp. NBC_01796]|uniref:hypothetical protein n=1 Tax=Micromonospora sp. NBC_01796 TaxID=2975987 RepID=UPI002DD86DB9|nr:hypothetical protein [Micromonospora sp. NBC_01796]WSA86706.1 hypothetical protein OIE47_03510 [Micromonospora sp. NBC_01796]
MVGEEASVQFAGDNKIIFRVTAVSDELTYEGWGWITGYVLDSKGEAKDRREIFVVIDGLKFPRGRKL